MTALVFAMVDAVLKERATLARSCGFCGHADRLDEKRGWWRSIWVKN